MNIFYIAEAIIKGLLHVWPNIKNGWKQIKFESIINSKECFKFPYLDFYLLYNIFLKKYFYRKSYFLKCRQCYSNGKRGQTLWLYSRCEGQAPLRVETCFANQWRITLFHFAVSLQRPVCYNSCNNKWYSEQNKNRPGVRHSVNDWRDLLILGNITK